VRWSTTTGASGRATTTSLRCTRVAEVFPFAAQLRDALANARRRPTVAHYAQFSETFRRSVDDYLRGGDPLLEKVLRDRLEAALKGRPAPGD